MYIYVPNPSLDPAPELNSIPKPLATRVPYYQDAYPVIVQEPEEITV